MENEIYYGRRTQSGECDVFLDYYLIPEKLRADYTDLMCYGIQIIKTSFYEGGGRRVDISRLDSVFFRLDDADKFMRLIMKKSVAPARLREAIDDYISSCLSVCMR